MLTAGRGSIVNTASVNANLPASTVIDYGAAKAALVNLTKALSKEFGPHGIRWAGDLLTVQRRRPHHLEQFPRPA
jgi:NAD(P)-dependent dehydrogenase (short-subunit alcohol dehydrogenase family)